MKDPILLQGAVDAETGLFEEKLTQRERHKLAGYTFETGYIGDVPVVLARTGIGSIHAAASTALAVERFGPCLVLNQGLAGGHDLLLRRGDVVVGESIVPINAYDTPGRGEGEGVDPFSWKARMGSEPMDPALADRAYKALCVHSPRVFRGVIGSGDIWNRETDWISYLHRQYRTACEEMESFAVATVSRGASIPFLAVRILSNHEPNGESYDRTIGEKLQKLLLLILPQLYDYVATVR